MSIIDRYYPASTHITDSRKFWKRQRQRLAKAKPQQKPPVKYILEPRR